MSRFGASEYMCVVYISAVYIVPHFSFKSCHMRIFLLQNNMNHSTCLKTCCLGTSLVVQWLRMQGTRVRPLVREDSTCLRAARPMHYNY